ncbi:MAG: Rne/Rng family ribonuclease [Paracoccaceae bacterium]|nr:Rne/Rng family ribonuclease [Paracoccaceae bacterium]
MAKKMLIDATHTEETRVVVADGNKVDEFDFESITKRQLAGNIYLAKVTRVEPSLQAAFVDYGGNRHGFLAFSEIHPDYYQIPVADREALLAEEAAEQARSAEREENGNTESDKPKRGRKRRSKAKPAARAEANENGEVKGLEVIDFDEPEETETGPAEITGLAAAEDETTEPRSDDATEAVPGNGDKAVDTGDLGDGDEPSPPKSLAEAAGLDDDDSISEDVLDAPVKPAAEDEAATAPDKPKRRSRRKKTEPAADVPDNGDGSEAGAEAITESAEADAGDEKKPPRSRRRRTRGKAKDATAKDEDKAAPAKPRAKSSDPDDTDSEENTNSVESIEPDDAQEEAARVRATRRHRYKIQDVVKVRQIMLVQVVKEERGNKGAALTTYLSLAGRYCVLMPNTARGGGISRKITSAGDRKRLRDITGDLDVPQGMGLIVRTAGAERTKAEIKRDYEFLLRQWEQIRDLTLNSIAPTLIHEEGSLIKRSIRDLYSKEIDTILVEGEDGYREAKDYMKMLMPSHARHVQQYTEQIPLFIRYQVESYLNAMFSPVVQLRSGGYIVIGITEALVAIDVNSGRSTKESSIEETALKTNLEAADEVCRQLRLRDLAGLIVIDFIDMEENRNNRAVEKRMKDRLKADRARIQVGRISPFGLMEMSRQRLRPGMLEATTQPCPHCQGQGIVRSDENLSLSILREVEEEGVRGRSAEVTVTAPVGIANYIMNMKRPHLAGIEARYGLAVSVLGDPMLISPEFRIERSKSRSRGPDGAEVTVTPEPLVSGATVDAPSVRAVPASDDGDGEDGEGRSRRRRGKRGGQRRRRGENGENGGEGQTETAEAGEDAEGDAKPEGKERRSRRRRGGRGRSRRRETDQEAAEATAEGNGPEVSDAEVAPEADVVEPAPEPEISEEATVVDAESADVEAPEAPAPEAAPDEAAEAPSGPSDGPSSADVDDAQAEEPPSVEAEESEPLAAAPEIVPEPAPVSADEPAKPKRRGWWSRG